MKMSSSKGYQHTFFYHVFKHISPLITYVMAQTYYNHLKLFFRAGISCWYYTCIRYCSSRWYTLHIVYIAIIFMYIIHSKLVYVKFIHKQCECEATRCARCTYKTRNCPDKPGYTVNQGCPLMWPSTSNQKSACPGSATS